MNKFDERQFCLEFFEAADSLVPERWYDYFDEKAEISFGDTWFHGKEYLTKNFPVFSLLAYMKHTVTNLWYHKNKFGSEVSVIYKIKGDPEQKEIPARAMTYGLIDEENRKLKEYRVYFANQAFQDRVAYVLSLKDEKQNLQ